MLARDAARELQAPGAAGTPKRFRARLQRGNRSEECRHGARLYNGSGRVSAPQSNAHALGKWWRRASVPAARVQAQRPAPTVSL